MAMRTVTSKNQIPKYIQKRITNFKNLTPNKAIFEYEKFLLLRRAKGDYKEFLKGYIEAPERVTKKDIQKLHEMRGKKLEQKRYEYERESCQISCQDTNKIFHKDASFLKQQ